MLSTVLFSLYFHTVISMFSFLCYWSHSKAYAVNEIIQLCFYERSTIDSQSNVQAGAAENEEQYAMSKIIYIKLQKCCFLSLRSILKGGAPKMYTNQLKVSKIFSQICSYLWEFFEILRTSVSNISIKVIVYIYGRRLRSEKT